MISQRENVHKLCTCRVCCYVSHFLYYCGGTWSDTPPLGHGSFRYVLTLHGTNSIQQSSGEFSSHRSGLFAQQRPAEATPIPTSSGHSFSSYTDTSYRHIIMLIKDRSAWRLHYRTNDFQVNRCASIETHCDRCLSVTPLSYAVAKHIMKNLLFLVSENKQLVRNHHIGQDIELLLLVVLLFEVGSRSLLTMAEEGQCKCLLTRLSKDFIASFQINLPLLSTYSPFLILFLQIMLMLEHEIIATKKDTEERALSPFCFPLLPTPRK